MLRISIYNTFVFLVFFSLTAKALIADEQNWQLEISLSKNIFLLNEPIWIDVTLRNVNKDTMRIFGLCPPCRDGSFDIEIEDSHGEMMPYTGPVYNMTHSNGWVIDPQEEYYRCFNLLEFYGIFKNGLIGSTWLRFLPPGKYKICARYFDTQSQQLEFEVIEPEGEEKQAFEEYYSAYITRNNQEFDVVIQRLRNFINRYPNSVYNEKAYWDLPEDDVFLQKYPNSGFNELNLRSLTYELEPMDKENFLQKVIDEYQNSRSAKFAEQMLRMLEKESGKDTTRQEMRK